MQTSNSMELQAKNIHRSNNKTLLQFNSSPMKKEQTHPNDEKLNLLRTNYYDSSHSNSGAMYRSNSNLELHDCGNFVQYNGNNISLKRVSSHGSIDLMADKQHDLFAKKMSKEANAIECVDRKNLEEILHQETEKSNSDSPKFNLKLKLWSQGNKSTASKSQSSNNDEINNSAAINTSVISADIEERARRRSFAHFDCQSLMVNLGYAARLRGLLLSRRRNTTTGASAAAMYNTRSSTPDADVEDDETDRKLSNELLETCPFFRNEIGGEIERYVGLSRISLNSLKKGSQDKEEFHCPSLAYGVSVLECSFGESLWRKHSCPYEQNTSLIEENDNGAYYYRKYFLEQEHQNWFGMDDQLGPVAISIKKEKPLHQPLSSDPNHQQHLYRIIVRTSELLTLRGSIFEDSIPNPRGSRGKSVNTKDILDYVAPEVQSTCLRLAISSSQCEQQILKLDEQGISNKYKVGILYCREGQATEEDMYNNMESGPSFIEFLESFGKVVRLKGFQNYKAGLDTKTDSTGTHSVYATYCNCEVMFHVSTMLPYTPNNRQQLLRKRHIGNDIVTIIFQEPGAKPFTPKHIRSQFQHVFIVVRVINPCSDGTLYHVAVTRSKELSIFGPPLKYNAIYAKGKKFTEFLLAKIINAENAAHKSKKFATMATRTRQEYLKDLCSNYVNQITLDSGQKFSIFSSKKKEPYIPRFTGDASQRGAFCWQIVLDDCGLQKKVDCYLGISSESFVLIEESAQKAIFVIPNRSILGWSTNGNALRIFYHQGECLTINMHDFRDRDEQLEVIERLRAVSCGTGALELNLQRNSLGQLGFHLQPDGIVTTVEINGPAWSAGLRQGYRLVEICKVAIATLSHDQMVDLLKTSLQVTVTVIESHSDFSPRRGCFLPNCKFNAINYDYNIAQSYKKLSKSMYNESSTSNVASGYESGATYSSGFTCAADLFSKKSYFIDSNIGTLTSSSSGHSSSEDKWYSYDFIDANMKSDASKSEDNRSQLYKNPSLVESHLNRVTEFATSKQPSYSLTDNRSSDNNSKTSLETSIQVSKPKKESRINNHHSSTDASSEAPILKLQTTNYKNNNSMLVNDMTRRPISLRLPNHHRHSTHTPYTSNFQEDLMKLISPEYLNTENYQQDLVDKNRSSKEQNLINSLVHKYKSPSKVYDSEKNSTFVQNRKERDIVSLEKISLNEDTTCVTTARARPATIVATSLTSSSASTSNCISNSYVNHDKNEAIKSPYEPSDAINNSSPERNLFQVSFLPRLSNFF